jgi:hypothetical protein
LLHSNGTTTTTEVVLFLKTNQSAINNCFSPKAPCCFVPCPKNTQGKKRTNRARNEKGFVYTHNHE